MAKVGELKNGNYAIINGEPSQIVQIQKSKPGKHGLFDGRKQSFVSSTSANIQIPIVDKRSGQVLSVTPNSVQIMDLENYETMDIAMPKDKEIASKLEAGKDIEYWNIMDRFKIQRVKN